MTKSEKIKELEDKLKSCLLSFDHMTDFYERQLELQDSEITRLNVIIHYLETKDLK